MDYLKRAVELSQISFDAGEFPAGAVLVSKNGNVYESSPSLPYNHGEMMVMDMAIAAEGAPLTGAKIYASMEPCLMCASKIYWSGVESVEYVIPKESVTAEYAYENAEVIKKATAGFFRPIPMTNIPDSLAEALEVYRGWERKIQG